MRTVLPQNTVALVIAVFTEPEMKISGTLTRARDRIWLMPAGVMRYHDLQQVWIRENCKRLTWWTTKV